MSDRDFVECEFIESNLRYLTFCDFCENCRAIKRGFKQLSPSGQIFYKYYVYSNIHMSETFKNYCWDYLNDFITKRELFYRLGFYRTK